MALKKKGSAKKEAKAKTEKKKDSFYAWLSLACALFFWVPLINIIVILPASVYFGIRAMMLSKKNPERYGGFWLALFSAIFAFICFVIAVAIVAVEPPSTLLN